MTGDEPHSGNVHPYRRQKLEPEIAAMSVETEDDDQPTVIVNIDDPAAKPAIRKVIILVGAAFGGLAELIKRVASERHRTITAIASTAIVTVTATTVVPAVLDDNKHRPPPIAIERVVTLSAPSQPAATVTATITEAPQPSAAAPTKPARSAEPAVFWTRLPSSKPTPERSARTNTPVKTPARKTPTPTPRASDDELAAEFPATMPTRQLPSDTPAPEPEASPEPPSQDPAPTVAAAGCGGIIHVDVDPLLDVCVLG
ncbi:hypothetical protein ACQP2T_63695 (plasmid) [Nonomuraea sp. CA-143628]|uniref:hypothetical protein n=1 Tax=Nonomuraea sp. CA-143628 TaxID=3239997 RepID=UPI003D945DF7